jgi:hypothetical protein
MLILIIDLIVKYLKNTIYIKIENLRLRINNWQDDIFEGD